MRLKATSSSEIKSIFGGRCATCGAYEGEPDPRYGGENVKLQQGHKDPCAAGDDYHNIISTMPISVIGLTEMTMNLTTEGVSMQWQTLVR